MGFQLLNFLQMEFQSTFYILPLVENLLLLHTSSHILCNTHVGVLVFNQREKMFVWHGLKQKGALGVLRGKKLSYGIMSLIRSKYQNTSGIFLRCNSSLFLAHCDDVAIRNEASRGEFMELGQAKPVRKKKEFTILTFLHDQPPRAKKNPAKSICNSSQVRSAETR